MVSSKINIVFFLLLALSILASVLLITISVNNIKFNTNSLHNEITENSSNNHVVISEISHSAKASNIVAGSATLNLDDGRWIDGKWKGAANQFDDKSNWTIVLKKQPGSKYFVVEYPSIKCQGYLDLLTISSKKAEFRELITAGNCVNSVRIEIVKINKSKAYYKAYWPEDTHLNAEGVLRKVE